MSAWKPPTGPGSAPKEITTEGTQITSSMGQSKPADNRLATDGWDIPTKTQLLSAGSSN